MNWHQISVLTKAQYQETHPFCTHATAVTLRFVLCELTNSFCLVFYTKNRSFVQHCYYRSDGQLFIGGIKSHKYNKNRCLVDLDSGPDPGLYECEEDPRRSNMLWDFKQVEITVLKSTTERSVLTYLSFF